MSVFDSINRTIRNVFVGSHKGEDINDEWFEEPRKNPLDDMPVASEPEVTAPPVDPEIPTNLKWLSKIKLEEIGRTLGIELDRRHNKKKLIKELEDHLATS